MAISVYLTEPFLKNLTAFLTADRDRIMAASAKIAIDPNSGGLNPEKLKKGNDLWSYRVTQNIRIIARREDQICSLIAVDRHDKAYQRAEAGHLAGPLSTNSIEALRRKNDISPSLLDGDVPISPTGPLAGISDERLTSEFGVPAEWIATLRSITDCDQLWSIGIEEVLTTEQFFRLEELFPVPSTVSTGARPVFKLSTEALARAYAAGDVLDLQFNLPATSWAIVESAKQSPVLVKGGPGSGKTLVGLYRALHILEADLGLGLLAKPRVLYVTYTNQLCDDARNKIARLRGAVPAGLTISTFDALADDIAGSSRETVFPKDGARFIDAALRDGALDRAFFESEITDCIQWRNVQAFDEYEGLDRRGRGARLGVAGRRDIWAAYEKYCSALASERCRDLGMMRMQAAAASSHLREEEKYDFVIVDEVQDLPLPVLLMVANLAKGQGRAKHLMLLGDAGQAIYNRGFSWAAVGLRIGGGNVHTVAQSERSTQEILDFAGALFGFDPFSGSQAVDVETIVSSKRGERPRIVDGIRYDEEMHDWLVADVKQRILDGIPAECLAVIAHSHKQLAAVGSGLRAAGLKTVEQGSKAFYGKGTVKLITAHSSKGLEFPEVYLPDVNDGVYPFYKNRDLPDDERSDMDVQDCQLLYVAATRAADRLTVLYHRDASPFLQNARHLANAVDGTKSGSAKDFPF